MYNRQNTSKHIQPVLNGEIWNAIDSSNIHILKLYLRSFRERERADTIITLYHHHHRKLFKYLRDDL